MSGQKKAQKIESAYTHPSAKNRLNCISVMIGIADGDGSTSWSVRSDLPGAMMACSAGIDEMQPEMMRPHWMAYMVILRERESDFESVRRRRRRRR